MANLFKIQTIIEKSKGSNITPFSKSVNKFWLFYENQFDFLDDQNTIIGVDANDQNQLLIEDLTNTCTIKVERQQSSITNLIFDKTTMTLLAGGKDGCIVQFKLDLIKKIAEKIKIHKVKKIGHISSSCIFMNFVFFGGTKMKVKALNLSNGKLIPEQINTSIESILSLEIFCIDNSKIYLSICGDMSNDSENNFDLLNLSDLFQKRTINPQYFSEIFYSIIDSRSDQSKSIVVNQSQKSSLKDQSILTSNNEKNKYNYFTDEKNIQIKHLENKLRKLEDQNKYLIEENLELKKKYKKIKEKNIKLKNKIEQQNLLNQKTINKNSVLKHKKDYLSKRSDNNVKQLHKKILILHRENNYKKSIIQNILINGQQSKETDPVEIIFDLNSKLEVKNKENKKNKHFLKELLIQIDNNAKKIQLLSNNLGNLEYLKSKW